MSILSLATPLLEERMILPWRPGLGGETPCHCWLSLRGDELLGKLAPILTFFPADVHLSDEGKRCSRRVDVDSTSAWDDRPMFATSTLIQEVKRFRVATQVCQMNASALEKVQVSIRSLHDGGGGGEEGEKA